MWAWGTLRFRSSNVRGQFLIVFMHCLLTSHESTSVATALVMHSCALWRHTHPSRTSRTPRSTAKRTVRQTKFKHIKSFLMRFSQLRISTASFILPMYQLPVWALQRGKTSLGPSNHANSSALLLSAKKSHSTLYTRFPQMMTSPAISAMLK